VKERYRDGGGAQSAAAYSRAVRSGRIVAVSGTAATGPDGRALHPGDGYAQTRECFDRALAALAALGGGVDDVIRTRMLLTPDCDPGGPVSVHKEIFEGREPANTTFFVAGFIPEGVLVEVELDAVLEEHG
jgi:enamine deaminase RidA (YjgF/YER057c/UK114 family)